MNGFRYKHGDRPLEGYTIQRAVGRGGFGEVYYAVSDSGREVALKAVQGYQQIELRGVGQCMNLKSPHLVTIFDVKHNDEGTPFVIMEYVSGPSLRELLNESPSGIGTQKAAFFLREIGKGLTFLHDRGIVHRDLKPGNIFYEDGYVKIGDYGLSKAISPSQHSGQTITVGTVHYMAPEIGKGRYDRGIDVYALGVLLYEMLTGQVPFFGASHGEVLMKHLMAEPDVTGIEEPFATVIRKAMAKEPGDRYESVQVMIEAVFGAEHIQQSVSHFRPESLSMVAERAAQKVTVGGAGSSAEHAPRLGPPAPPAGASDDPWQEWGQRLGRQMSRVGTRIGQRFQRWSEPGAGEQGAGTPALAAAAVDPFTRGQRRRLWLVTTAVMAIGTGVLSSGGKTSTCGPNILLAAAAIIGASIGVGWTLGRSKLQIEKGLVHSLAFGGAAFVGAAILSVWVLNGHPQQGRFGEGWLLTLLGLFLIDWRERVDPTRSERVSLGQAFSAGLLGFVLSLVLNADKTLVIGTFAGISMAVEALSPFIPKEARPRGGAKKAGAPGGAAQAQRSPAAGSPPPLPGQAAPGAIGHRGAMAGRPFRTTFAPRQVPVAARVLSLILFVGLLGLGLTLLIGVGVANLSNDEFALAVSFGIGAMGFSLFFLAGAIQSTYRSLWSGVWKPLILLCLAQTALTSAVCLGCMNLSDDETMIAVGFIVFPSILFLVAACISNRMIHQAFGMTAATASLPGGISPKQRVWAIVLALLMFVTGFGGIHRFYVGKIGTGLLWLLTFGLLGVGQIVDVMLIAFGVFTDKQGRRLVLWHSDELKDRHSDAQMYPRTHADHAAVAPDRVAGELDGLAADQLATPEENAPVAFDSGAAAVPAVVSASAYARQPGHPLSVLLGMLGSLLLLAAFVVGLALAIDMPHIISAGLPDPGLAEELNREFGYTGWPKLFNEIGMAVAALLMVAAAAVLIVARRHGGVAHMLRVLLGIGGLAAVLSALREACSRVNWRMIAVQVENDEVGPAIERFLDTVDHQVAIFAGVLLLISIIVLAWPPRQRNDRFVPELEQQSGGKG